MLIGLLTSSFASAQVLVASSLDDTHTHAWAVYENSNNEIVLVHLPPRDGDLGARIPIDPALPGELHAVRTLNKFPDGLAAIGNRVYLVFPTATVGERKIGRVYSGKAVPSPVGSVWGFTPSGRLDSEPAIQIEGELVDLVATSDSVWALIKADNEYHLITLADSSWEAGVLPVVQSPVWRISALGDRVVAVDLADDNNLQAYVLGEDHTTWTTHWSTLPSPMGDFEIIASLHGLFILDQDEHGSGRIQTWSNSGIFTIASGLDLPTNINFSALDSVNRLVGIAEQIQLDTDISEASQSQPTVQVYEIDLADGSMVYVGEPVVSSPVSAAEMRFLMGMMVLIMVGVLVVVIMPDRADAMGIPDGFALADPGRRLMATMFDVFFVSFVMGLLFDVRVIEIITLSVIVRSDTSWLVIPAVLISGIVSMSLLEWLVGASPGKWLMGIRVVRGVGGPMSRIPLWAAIVRNMIKWLVPPVAALVLLDPERLHRGDRATRTLVVAPIEDFDGSQSSKDSGSEG